ncbi:MAG: S41 family peptidase [Candidatus Pacebacteria bacterium]|nr:S41 family peptidase [Candidatus Paceibacterota bacterium]
MKTPNRFIFIFSILIALGIGYGAGYIYFQKQNTASVDAIIKQVINKDQGKSDAVDFNLFWQVWDKLHARFVDKDSLETQKLVYGAISGMVQSAGDPYTVFFEPVTSKKFQEQVSGAFSGVGMEIGMRDNLITVISPLKDSPAMKAGIVSGDVVIKVDATDTEHLTVEEAVNLIRGKQGTHVVLTVLREGADDKLTFDIIRDTIKIHAVEWRMLDNKIAYMQITSFNANVDEEFVRAAKELSEAGAERLIIDVRNNPGGLLDSAVHIAGWFLKNGSVVVSEHFSNGTIDELRTNGNSKLATIPTALLMNGGSASAAEILAGALHDVRNIELVGEKTFGKGSVQQVEEFYNGSSLKVTIAKWYTPNGVNISKMGIEPTVVVPMTPAEYKEKGWQFGMVGKDPQLDKAIEVVRKTR